MCRLFSGTGDNRFAQLIFKWVVRGLLQQAALSVSAIELMRLRSLWTASMFYRM